MNSLYFHLGWFSFFLAFSLSSFLFSLYLSYSMSSFYFSFPLFSFWFMDMNVSFYFDFMSCWFTTVVLVISTVIMVYSYFYMHPYSKTNYFLSLTILFVLSMILVINMSDLFFIMLGWDGLGLISFFLIVYYQNQSSITSGLFTLLMNRIGDSFFLVSIVFFYYHNYNNFSFSSEKFSCFYLFFLMITFMTKSALFPFSPWLPLAMAAPTPISALVHSSTLVASGLYLMMRYATLFYSSFFLMKLLMVFSIFTSFYAGMNSIVEKDLKKLIALSTLSHLGFIGLSFSCGLLYLSFFHLLTHALFKSLLFMTMGDIMINLNHSQDIRYLSLGVKYTPFSCFIMYVSLLNLLGLPSLSGFFSKDLVLESINYSNFSFSLSFILYTNVFFTYFYTYQLFYFSFQSSKLSPYQNFHSPMIFHSTLLLSMCLLTLFFGFFYLSHINPFIIFVSVSFTMKILPLLINFIVFIFLLFNSKLFTFNHTLINFYFSNMMFLSNVMMTLSSNFFFKFNFNLVKSTEFGLLNFSVNSFFYKMFYFIQRVFFNLSMLKPMKMILFSCILLVIMIFFV